MKKYITTQDYILFNQRRADQRLSRKLRRSVSVKKTKNKKRARVYFPVSLKMPSNFSIIDNPIETLEFFEIISESLWHKKSLYLNLSEINLLTPDAILYLLSTFDSIKSSLKKIDVSGNAPDNTECRDFFVSSGFYDYVLHKSIRTPQNSKMLSVKSANIVEPVIAKDVIEFSLNHLGKSKSVNSANIYTTLIECMANTKNHAFFTKSKKIAKWWLMAHVSKDSNKVNFTFLDNGLGIPTTVRKKVYELFLGYKDHKLIKSCLKREFLRSRTGEKWRGNGLPKIYEFSKTGQIEDLCIISNKGYLKFKESSLIEQYSIKTEPFRGTLLSWNFV